MKSASSVSSRPTGENLARELDHHADTLTRSALYFRERARIAREKAQVIRDAH